METTQIAVSTSSNGSSGREQAQKALAEAAASLPGTRTVTTASGGLRASFSPSGRRSAPKPVEQPAAEPAQGEAEEQPAAEPTPAQRQHPPLTESRVTGLLHVFVKQALKSGASRKTALSEACTRLMKIIARTELMDAERGARFQQVSTALTEWKAFWAEYDARRQKPAETERAAHEEPKGVSSNALGDGLASIGQITLVPPARREECLDDSVPASPVTAPAKAAPNKIETAKRSHISLAAPGRVKKLVEGAVRRNRESGKGKEDAERLARRWVMDLVVHDEELTREERAGLIAEIRAGMPHQPLTPERIRELIERRIKRFESEGASSDEAARKAAGRVWHLVESDDTLSAEAKQERIAIAKSYLPKPAPSAAEGPATERTERSAPSKPKHPPLTDEGRVEELMRRFTDERSVEAAANRVLAIAHREVCDSERGRVFDRVKDFLQSYCLAPLRRPEGCSVEEIETANNQAIEVFEEAMKKFEPKKPRRPQGQQPARGFATLGDAVEPAPRSPTIKVVEGKKLSPEEQQARFDEKKRERIARAEASAKANRALPASLIERPGDSKRRHHEKQASKKKQGKDKKRDKKAERAAAQA